VRCRIMRYKSNIMQNMRRKIRCKGRGGMGMRCRVMRGRRSIMQNRRGSSISREGNTYREEKRKNISCSNLGGQRDNNVLLGSK
jgi:hypothetical protein